MHLSIWLLATVPALVSLQEEPGKTPDVSAGAPRYELWSDGVTHLRFDEHFWGEVFARTDTRTVFCSWLYLPSPPSSKGKGGPTRKYTTAYWPTDVAGDGGLGLYVAGRAADGKTLIEKWSFAQPPEPLLGPVDLERTSVETLSISDTAGRRDVVQLARMATTAERLLVYFDDSREVWVLDVETRTWKKVAGPKDRTVLLVPELAEDWKALKVRRHRSVGTMYVFSRDWKDTTLSLLDADNDGVPETHIILTTEQWGDQGFGDPASYVD